MVGKRMRKELKKIFGWMFSGGRYSEDAYISCVLIAASVGAYLENIKEEGLPNADSVHRKIKEVGEWELLRRCYKEYVKDRLERYVRGREYYVIIDETPWAYYGGNFINNLYLWGYRKERGSTASFLFLSALIVIDDKFKFYFDCLPVQRIGYFREEAVESLLKEIIEWIGYKPKFVLLDRGFFSHKAIEKLEHLGVKYIVHARLTPRIKKKVGKVGHSDAKFKYYLNDKVLTTLYIHHCKSSDTSFVFVSNLEKLPATIRQIYRNRWKIETEFRVFKTALIKSKSTNILIRFFFILFAITISLIHKLFSLKISLRSFLLYILRHLPLLSQYLINTPASTNNSLISTTEVITP